MFKFYPGPEISRLGRHPRGRMLTLNSQLYIHRFSKPYTKRSRVQTFAKLLSYQQRSHSHPPATATLKLSGELAMGFRGERKFSCRDGIDMHVAGGLGDDWKILFSFHKAVN